MYLFSFDKNTDLNWAMIEEQYITIKGDVMNNEVYW